MEEWFKYSLILYSVNQHSMPKDKTSFVKIPVYGAVQGEVSSCFPQGY